MLIVILSFVLSLAGAVASPFVFSAEFPSGWWIPIVAFIVIFVGFYVVFYGVAFIISLFFDKNKIYEKQNPISNFYVNQTLFALYFFAGARVKVEGLEKLPKCRFLMVYNHKSGFDPIIQGWKLRKYNLIQISKPENFKIPIAGPFIHRNCYLAVNRDSAKEALKTIDKATEFIATGKFSVGISPEGTRNKGDGLLPFKNGCFKMALTAKCPIVVCCLEGAGDIMKNFPFKRTKVKMTICKVFEYDEFKDMGTADIATAVRKTMAEQLRIENGQLTIEN